MIHSKIKGVVFDFGGVITSTSMPERVRAKVREYGLPWDKVVEGFANHRLDYDQGKITLTELYNIIWQEAGIEVAPTVRKEIEEADSASWLYRNERTLKWMRELRAKGFVIGILTNMPPSFAPLFREHFADFIAESSALVISGEVGVVKPNAQIYQILVDRIGLKPEELLFIDDVEKNCQGARDCGWSAIRFESNDQIEQFSLFN